MRQSFGRLRAAAHTRDEALAYWIERHATFPDSMADPIVPATDPADMTEAAERLGVEDRAMVKTEPFFRWVIEDRFAGLRPDFEATGATPAASVAPWEEAKLRLLNGAHSTVAYLGGLAGIAFVHEFVALQEGRQFVEALWNESVETLVPPQRLDPAAYCAALMRRLENPALAHRTRQITTDGSQKLPQRLLASMMVLLERGLPIDALALAVAAWMRWQGGVDDAGRRFRVEDPLAGAITQRLTLAGPGEQVDTLLAMRAIFPEALIDSQVRDSIARWYRLLEQQGALAALSRFTACDKDGRA